MARASAPLRLYLRTRHLQFYHASRLPEAPGEPARRVNCVSGRAGARFAFGSLAIGSVGTTKVIVDRQQGVTGLKESQLLTVGSDGVEQAPGLVSSYFA